MATSTTRRRKATASPNVEAVKDLLLWARTNKLVVHGITVGDVTITCTDPVAVAQPGKPGRREPAKPQPGNVYEDIGGEAWRAAVAEAEGRDPDLEDDNDIDEDDEHEETDDPE